MGDGGMDGDRDLWDRLGAGGFGGSPGTRGGKAATRAEEED